MAIGVEHFAYVPAPLPELPASACTHSSAHTDLAAFRGQEVVVVGAGQSALETAALLHENGATVQVLARRHVIGWNGLPLDPDRPLLRRLREPEAGLGSGWSDLVLLQPPGAVPAPAGEDQGVPGPHGTRAGRGLLAPPAGGGPVPRPDRPDRHLGQRCSTARCGCKVRRGGRPEVTADHVIAATGYRINLKRLGFLPDAMRSCAEDRGRERCGRTPTTSRPFPGSSSWGRRWRPAWGRS